MVGGPASLCVVDAAGGTLGKLQLPNLKPGRRVWPEFLPNGEDFFFLLLAPLFGGEAEVYSGKLGEFKVVKGPTLLMKNATAGHFSAAAGGQFLFVKNDDLFAQRLDTSTWKLMGEPRMLVRGVRSSPGDYRPDFSVSRTGVMAWRSGRAAL